MICNRRIESALGNILLSSSGDFITRIHFAGDEEIEISQSTHPVLLEAEKQLEKYFSGELKEFTIPLAPAGTVFQQKVWQLLLQIPFGVTCSYQELALRYGDLLSIRAIASANGKNPLAIVIPCHRVIGSDGSLTGYAGGLDRKKWLLAHEGVPVFRQTALFSPF